MRTVQFDDGSTATFDDAGNPLGGVDSSGAPYAPASTNVVQQVVDLLSLGVRSAIYSKYGASAQQAAGLPVPPTPQSQQQQLMMVGLLIVGAVVLFKLAS